MNHTISFDNFVKVNKNISTKYQNIKLPWVEKYRPIKIDDIISHDQNIDTIKKFKESSEYITMETNSKSWKNLRQEIKDLVNEIGELNKEVENLKNQFIVFL